MNDDEAREMLEGGSGRPAGHVQDVSEGRGPFAFGAPDWSGVAKLNEELGELVALVGKLMATGGDPQHWQGDLRPKLLEEMADVSASIEHVLTFAFESGSRMTYQVRIGTKLRLFARWHQDGLVWRASQHTSIDKSPLAIEGDL